MTLRLAVAVGGGGLFGAALFSCLLLNPTDGLAGSSAEIVNDAASTGDADGGGCDASFADDPANCGACGHSCLGGTCAFGACAASVIGYGQSSPTFIAVDDAAVYWTNFGSNPNFTDGAVMRWAKGASSPGALVSGLRAAWGIAADGRYVYYTSINYDRVVRRVDPKSGVIVNLSGYEVAGPGATVIGAGGAALFWIEPYGSNVTSVHRTSIPDPGQKTALSYDPDGSYGHALAVDTATVYFVVGANTGAKQIKSVPIAGCPDAGACGKVLVSAIGPSALTVDDTFLYFGDASSKTIKRAIKADGTSQRATLLTNVEDAHALVLDGDWLYYTDYALDGSVGRMHRDGSDKSVLAIHQVYPFGLTTDSTAIYWVTQGALSGNTHDAHDGTVRRLAK